MTRPVSGNQQDGEFSSRAHDVIPGGAHTYSKGDDQFPSNAPRAFVRGKGGRVWDLDGRQFVDWGMGINNVLIGHAEDSIDEAAVTALRNGQNFSRPTMVEVEAAEALVKLFDGMDMAKFAKNGSDANSAALRLARAITGRELVAYDGSAPFLSIHDWFIGNTVMDAGIPDAISRLAVPFRYNDPESVERVFAEHPRKLAAVILEPCRETKPSPGFLDRLRALCSQHGTLLIFDEVVTAFRYSLHGAYSLLGVVPDLLSVGKAMANGYALTALLGRRDYMERGGLRHKDTRCFLLSTTSGAEQSALAAGLATIRFYQDHNVIGRLHETGRALMEGFNEAAGRNGLTKYLKAASDFACRPVVTFLGPDGQPSSAYRTLFLQEVIRKGVFMSWLCPAFRHGEAEISQTLEAFEAACAMYGRALEKKTVEGFLEGPATKPVFRTYNDCQQSLCGRLNADAPKRSCCLGQLGDRESMT
jgi:glutamate-1-semialdehyde 2,1-aminomutase